MDLDKLEGQKNPGLDLDRAGATVAAVLEQVPVAYSQLLSRTDGMALDSGALIYGSQELIERNETYEVATYMPGHLAIGDDGGGRLFLLWTSLQSPVLRVEAGALGSVVPDEVSESLEAWIAAGCPAATPAESREDEVPWGADVYLDVVPGGKLTNLLVIKNGLGLDFSIAELKKLAENLPACLATNVPYGKFRVRCNALNMQLGACLSLRTD